MTASTMSTAAGGGGSGGERVLMPMATLKQKIDQELPDPRKYKTSTLILIGERRLQGALANLQFNRLDVAYMDFAVAFEIAVNKVPASPDWPTLANRPNNVQAQNYARFKANISKHLTRFEEVKALIVADNAKNTTNTPITAVAATTTATTTAPPTEAPSSSSVDALNTGTLVRPKPGPKPPAKPPKPPGLQEKIDASRAERVSVDRPQSRGSANVPAASNVTATPSQQSHDELLQRFNKLKVGSAGLASAPGTTGSRQSIDSNKSSDMRKQVLDNLKTGGQSFPQPPEPAYSPIRQPGDNPYFPISDTRPPSLSRTSSLNISHTNGVSSAPPPPAPPPLNQLSPAPTGETIISAEKLSEILMTTKILIIDVRERSEFDQGHIFARSIICIEPLALREGMSARDLEDALTISPDKERNMFLKRDEYDYVVYHDQSTSSLNTYERKNKNPSQKALKILVQAIYEIAYEKRLKNPPKLLVSGLDAWVEVNGMTSLVPTAPASKANGLTRSGAKVVNLSDSARAAARRREKARSVVIGQVLTDAERSEMMAPEQPIEPAEEEEWIARLRRENSTISVRNAENAGDNKTRNRTTSIVSVESYPMSPDIEEFFERFPAVGRLDQSISTMGPPSPPPESGSSTGTSYPTLPTLNSQYPAVETPVSSMDEKDTPPAPPEKPTRIPPPPPLPRLPLPEQTENGLQPRNTIIDHVFHGFTDVQNPHFHPLPPPSPSRPPPAVPKKSYSGVSEQQQPSAPTLDPISTPLLYTSSQGGGFGTTGLKNLGNTCYMNSIIQCMSGTIPLARYFLGGYYRPHINRNNQFGSKGIFAESFANLNRNLWEETYAFVSPVTIKDISGRINRQFRGKDQQDAQEYLEFFLDSLHEDLNVNHGRHKLKDLTEEEERKREMMPIQQASAIEWQRYTHTNQSAIVSWFQGQFRSRLKCLTCGHTSTTYNPFMYLSLPIPPKYKSGGMCSLKECMDEFVKEEILDGEDAWHCPMCKKPRKASKQLNISRMPIVLIIHLKRFSNQGLWRDKMNTLVNFDRSVDLTQYVPRPLPPREAEALGVDQNNKNVVPPFHYSLYAVSNHYGSLTSGHYTAFVRVQTPGGGAGSKAAGVWHKFDDTKATKMEADDVVTRNAYILFWVRNGVM